VTAPEHPSVTALGRNPIFEGLARAGLEQVASLMESRRFDAGTAICTAGEPGDSLFVIIDGLAHVTLPDAAGEPRIVAKLRRGDVVGEMSMITGDPYSATVVAAVPTWTLEVSQAAFGQIVGRDPSVLVNLNRILSQRLAETTARVGQVKPRGESIALVVGPSAAPALPDLISAAGAASAGPIASLDARTSLDDALARLDDSLSDYAGVVLLADAGQETLGALLEHVDRTVAVGTEAEIADLSSSVRARSHRIEVVLVGGGGAGADESMPVVRRAASLVPEEIAWLGRHLARTKLGLALGAGGAKGFAHVGALAVLERAGYTVDYVAGSSIGAVVGACLALGMPADEIDRTLRATFTPEVVAETFKPSLTGGSAALATLQRIFGEMTRGKTFEDLHFPLVVMTVDLDSRQPRPLTAGPLSEALMAATALAGLFPAYEYDGQRLVDGLALVPVPTEAATAAGADVVVSVNLISRETLPVWPGVDPPESRSRPARSMVDTLLEVMDLSQLDSSVRHAGLADVCITPRFGPASWHDFALADLFREAGERAAEEQLPSLRGLARPQSSSVER
jgi:NTE family protein